MDKPPVRSVALPSQGSNLTWLAPLALMPAAVAGPNAALALYACVVLYLGTTLLWRPAEPPILLFIFLAHWVQAALGLFYGNIFGMQVDAVPVYPGQDEMAIFLLLTGALILATAIRLSAGPASRDLFPRAQAIVAARPLRFWVSIFVAAWFFSTVCASLAVILSGLRQPLLTLSQLKWAAFVLLTFATFAVPGRPKRLWLAVFCIQFLLSIGGFFSRFEDVFLYSLIGLVASDMRFNSRMILPATVLTCGVLFLGVVWTAIKIDYRAVVSAGTGQQAVLINYDDRVAELVRLVSELDGQDLTHATDSMARRLMYFEFFGVVLDTVPTVVPHSDGQIWREAVLRPFMPRLLFPDKSAVNDSELTNQYTDLGLPSEAEGTSISMGYMAEAYIDFGPVFMFLPVGVLGLFLGYFYRWLLAQPGSNVVFGMTLSPFALMPALFLETSALKLVPALTLAMIACWGLLRLLGPRLLRLDDNGKKLQFRNSIHRAGA